MKKVIISEKQQETVILDNCTPHHQYLLVGSNETFCLVKNTDQTYSWMNLSNNIIGSSIFDTVRKALEPYTKTVYYTPYQFNTMKELLQYYLEQIK
jgi:hypothetical protein